jgi:hypothetical protein
MAEAGRFLLSISWNPVVLTSLPTNCLHEFRMRTRLAEESRLRLAHVSIPCDKKLNFNEKNP